MTKTFGIRFFPLLAGGVLTLAGCASVAMSATFKGTPTPVMLGPVDRVGGTTPLKTTKVAPFETESVYQFTQGSYTSSYGSYSTQTNWQREESDSELKCGYDAHLATHDDPSLDIRLTSVKAKSYGVFSGFKTKSYVAFEGDVVKVEGAR